MTDSEWMPIESAPEMTAILLFHEYYSHGRVRHGYMDTRGVWLAVNADGSAGGLAFSPTNWMPLPEPPK